MEFSLPPAKPFTSRAGMSSERASITMAEAKYSQWPAISPSRKASTGERSDSSSMRGGMLL
jgi:hypothetical protein